jgi:peptide/nickel transport system substrate-binding protein
MHHLNPQQLARLGTLVLALACGTAQAQTLRWATQGDLQTLDPHARNELLTNSINGQVYETLITRDRQLRLVPGLATEWKQIDPTTWRMTLRSGVRFHDGAAFTADDVVFSYVRAQSASSDLRVYAAAMGQVRKVDDATVEFALPQINPVFLEHATIIPIMSKAWCEEHNAVLPQDFKKQEEKYSALNANGTGPFKVVSRQPDIKTVFQRNEQWWGNFEGNLREVVYTPVKSDATRTAALVSGSLDLILDPAPQDVQWLLTTPGIKVLQGVENRALFIGMDQARDELLYSSVRGKNPFKDVRIRKALYHAVDIETLRTKLMRGLAMPTGSVIASPLGNFNDPALEKRLPFDLAQARSLLAEAGYPNGFDVTLDCPNNRYIRDEAICVALAGMWAQIGVRVAVNAMPRIQFFAKGEKLDVSMYLLGWGGTITDAEVTLTPVLRSRGDNGVGYFNWGNYRNAKLDELAAASSREIDPQQREKLIRAALQEHDAQVHHIPLHRQVIPWAMRSNIVAAHRPDNWLEWRWITIGP